MTSFVTHARVAGGTHSARRRTRRLEKPAYKHVPHSEKPPHLVARRNARERRRVETVNNAFIRLRRHVPIETKHKRLSKVKTLRYAIDYIKRLVDMINEHDKQYGSPCFNFGHSVAMETMEFQQQRIRQEFCARDFQNDVTSAESWFQSG
ncbi:achaete-scute complex protein T4-like [Mya arenaria]|uniref:achaete-scute complex protein T4-like n=1 Tax=Mya arenaria TaxID=6604 RepID=UPI0022E457D2|nr:achaete-scute complex protein T4-like [Mya arenaria]